MFIYTLLTACGLMMTGCSGDKYSYYEGGATPNTEITATPTTLSVPVEGDTYAVAVGTTGVEWNAYSNEKWIQVEAQNVEAAKEFLAENPQYTINGEPSLEEQSDSAKDPKEMEEIEKENSKNTKKTWLIFLMILVVVIIAAIIFQMLQK